MSGRGTYGALRTPILGDKSAVPDGPLTLYCRSAPSRTRRDLARPAGESYDAGAALMSAQYSMHDTLCTALYVHTMLYARRSRHNVQCTLYSAHAAQELDNGQPVPCRSPDQASRGVPQGQGHEDRR